MTTYPESEKINKRNSLPYSVYFLFIVIIDLTRLICGRIPVYDQNQQYYQYHHQAADPQSLENKITAFIQAELHMIDFARLAGLFW
jgi:hypothetical protein